MKLGPTYPEAQKKLKIRKCLFALYLNSDVIVSVIRDKFDLLICYTTPNWFTNQIVDEIYPKIKILLENRVNLYVIPKEWNAGKLGLVKIIAEVLNLKILDFLRIQIDSYHHDSLGLVCQIAGASNNLNNLLAQLKEKLDLSTLQYLGERDSNVKKIGLILGKRLTPSIIKMAKRKEIDTIISNAIDFESEKIAEELNISVIIVTDYIVNLGLLKLTQALRMEHMDIEFKFINLKPSMNNY